MFHHKLTFRILHSRIVSINLLAADRSVCTDFVVISLAFCKVGIRKSYRAAARYGLNLAVCAAFARASQDFVARCSADFVPADPDLSAACVLRGYRRSRRDGF